MGENGEREDRDTIRTNLWYIFDGRPLRGLDDKESGSNKFDSKP